MINMRHLILLLSFIIINGSVFSQSDYSQQLEKAATSIATKIKNAGKTNVAVLDFENSNKQISELGSWLSAVFTTHLENNANGAFSVKNNTDVSKAVQQIKTESGSGAFDSRSIQRLGEISGSDVVIYAIITLMDDQISVNIKAFVPTGGTQTSIGGTIVNFLATEGMRTKYDNYIETKSSQEGTGGVSHEGTAKKSKDPNCKEKQTGDYCFQNDTKFNLSVSFVPPQPPNGWSGTQSLTLQPGQKQCIYDLYKGSLTYSIISFKNGQEPGTWNDRNLNYKSNGSLYVEPCQEKTFIIK